jgi:hypothetical protein
MIRQPTEPPRQPIPSPGEGPETLDRSDRKPDVAGPDTDDDLAGFPGDIVEEWGRQSFPASDPPANW